LSSGRAQPRPPPSHDRCSPDRQRGWARQGHGEHVFASASAYPLFSASSALGSLAMATPPTLTPEQRAAALAKAGGAGAARAEIKARLKMGSMTLKSALESDDPNV